MKTGLKEMKKAYKNVKIDKIEVFFHNYSCTLIVGTLFILRLMRH